MKSSLSSKLKIGIVSSFMPPHLGGLEVVAENLFHAYREAGHEVRWVASREPATTPSLDGGRIRVPCVNWSERWLGVPWPVWGPQGWRQISQVVRWADIIHIHDCLYMGNIIAAVLARKAQKPCILSQHIGFVSYRSRLLNAIESLAYRTVGRAVIRLVSHVNFCTPPVEDFIRESLKISPNSASRIPYGIDIERYHPPTLEERALARHCFDLQTAPKVVLFVGRLVEKKGVDLFLGVVRRRPDLHFFMVGDGPLRPPVLINLTWLPYVLQERMQLVYQAADVFLLPSHGEGFPMAVHEAMATGLPVLVSKGEHFAGILAQGKAGLPVERRASSFSEALTQVFEMPGLAVSLGKNGRELVAQKWSTQIMGQSYLRIIRSLDKERINE